MSRIAMVCLAAVAGTGCISKSGSGEVQTQQRLVPPFTRIAVEGPLLVTVTRGAQAVAFTTDSNLQPYLVANVVDGTLKLETAGVMALSPSVALQATVSLDGLESVIAGGGAELVADGSAAVEDWSVVASGGSVVAVHQLASKKLSIVATVGSRVDVQGAALRVTASGTGGSDVDTDGVRAEEASVQVSGSSTFRVRATRSVQGSATESSQLFISGNSTTRAVSGSEDARITWLDE